jgi:hypothetical protein
MPGRARWRWLALVVVLGAVAIALTVLPRGEGDRAATALLVIPGLAVGVAAGLALAARPAVTDWRRATRARTGAERFNDVAFSVVLLALWAVLAALLGRWSGLLTGLVVGLTAGLTARPTDAAAGQRPNPGH